uniref:Uncharacterized protein n=1 Tax=Romanomermis culicivorax TaxID=13658 RepID=A0A915KD92_ROMCU
MIVSKFKRESNTQAFRKIAVILSLSSALNTMAPITPDFATRSTIT